MDQVSIVPLGISAGSPTRDRHLASLAVAMDGRIVLFDCGEGTQYQLMRAPFRWTRIEAIFITHLHGDHLYGLPGLLGTLSLHGYHSAIEVYGPTGLREYLRGIFETTQRHRSYPLEVHDVSEGTVRKADGYSVEARLLDHGIPTFGYVLMEDPLPGTFDVEKAHRFNIPEGPLYGQLKSGRDVRLADGSLITSSELVGPPRPGRRISYCLDSRPCQGSVELSRGASVLVHEATYGSEHAGEARERAHSTAAEAAQVAARAGAKRLLLTHFSPRYLDLSVLVAEAQSIFPATEACEELRTYPVP